VLTVILGLAVGLQLLAYGGTQPLPYQQGICQSQALEAGITGNFTINAMSAVINHVGCDKTPLHSEETITCLRKLDTQTLLNAAIETYENDISHNVGDIWLPTVDGDFLPAPPSQLVKEGKFGNATYMFGWTEDDLNILTDPNIKADEDTRKNIGSFLPGMPPAALDQLLEQYPVEEFEPPSGTNLSAEFYRTGRILRDVIMVCQPFFMAESMHQKYSSIGHPAGLPYMYDFNQTILEPILEQLTGLAKLGVVHTAEFPYVFGNLTHWNVPGWPWSPTPQDHEVLKRVSRSWSTFASTGSPSARGRYTLQGWDPAYSGHDSSAGPNIYVIGGPFQGRPNLALDENLIKRCELLNSPEFIDYQGY
jgi:carboxylesterase type B